jgi:hypothetical protein
MEFGYFQGRLTQIRDLPGEDPGTAGCFKMMTVVNSEGSIVNFIVTPDTYFVDHVTLRVGNQVIGFYDANAPVPLIYPPQYEALVMARVIRGRNVEVAFFDSRLVSSDGRLKLNIGPSTRILLENDQAFNRNPANRNLVVTFGPTTRSIPAQTTPYEIIVLCL